MRWDCEESSQVILPPASAVSNEGPSSRVLGLAPPDADTIAVIAAHGWSTDCAVTADGAAWRTNQDWIPSISAGDRCDSGNLASSGGSHTVTRCLQRVLARCP